MQAPNAVVMQQQPYIPANVNQLKKPVVAQVPLVKKSENETLGEKVADAIQGLFNKEIAAMAQLSQQGLGAEGCEDIQIPQPKEMASKPVYIGLRTQLIAKTWILPCVQDNQQMAKILNAQELVKYNAIVGFTAKKVQALQIPHFCILHCEKNDNLRQHPENSLIIKSLVLKILFRNKIK